MSVLLFLLTLLSELYYRALMRSISVNEINEFSPISKYITTSIYFILLLFANHMFSFILLIVPLLILIFY